MDQSRRVLEPNQPYPQQCQYSDSLVEMPSSPSYGQIISSHLGRTVTDFSTSNVIVILTELGRKRWALRDLREYSYDSFALELYLLKNDLLRGRYLSVKKDEVQVFFVQTKVQALIFI